MLYINNKSVSFIKNCNFAPFFTHNIQENLIVLNTLVEIAKITLSSVKGSVSVFFGLCFNITQVFALYLAIILVISSIFSWYTGIKCENHWELY